MRLPLLPACYVKLVLFSCLFVSMSLCVPVCAKTEKKTIIWHCVQSTEVCGS